MTTARMRWPGLNRRSPLASGLVAHWPMWEGPGSGTIGDVVNPDPKVLRGVLTDMDPATAWVPGDSRVGGYALDFDGDNDHVVMGSTDALGLGGNFTVSAWFRRATGANPSTTEALVFRGGSTATDSLIDYISYLNTSAALVFKYSNGSDSRTVTSTTALSDTSWHHFAVTFVGGTGLELFLDGRSDATISTGETNALVSGRTFALGAEAEGSSRYFFDGQISQVAIHNKALTPSEIQLLYERPNAKLTMRRPVFPAVVAGGATLVVQDSACVVESESVALTQHHALVVDDSACAVTSEAVALTQHQVLSVADSACIVESDQPALTQHQALSVADSKCIVESELVALTQHQTLVVDDSVCIVESDNVTFAAGVSLVVQDSACVVESESVALTQHHALVVQDSACVVESEQPAFIQHQTLVVADSKCIVESDNVTFGSDRFAPYYYLLLAG